MVDEVTQTGFSKSSSVSSCRYRSTVALHAHIIRRDQQWARWWPQFRDIVYPIDMNNNNQCSRIKEPELFAVVFR
jgi:hypothetical protein